MSSILIVDDEEDIRSYLLLILEAEGFSVRAVPGALEALLEIQKQKPDLILLDLMMPQINGEELCRILRKDPGFFDIHIIILSAKGDTASKLSCFESGADDYLVKPIEAKELVARLRSVFRMLHRTEGTANFLDSTTSEMPLPGASASELSIQRIKPRYGNFRVESLVGSGGMGNVFKGYDEQLERTVAIKVLSRELSNSPTFVEKFHREAKIVASADHPGIAGIYTFGEQDGDFYFTMQWCSGGSIYDLIQRKGRVELLTAVDIIIQCIDALDAALAKGIVHRDIKPSNLMFDQYQRIKIVDFGLAASNDPQSQITPSGVHGTPDYMAPEQAQSGNVDHRADIYSLGITFYFLLYGKLPFESKSAVEMVIKHATEPFPEYEPLDGAVPREAYEIIQKMTQKPPEQRYQDYASCRRDLIALREEIFSSTGVLLPSVENLAPAPIWKTEDYFEILSALYVSPRAGVLTIRSHRLALKFLVENRHILFQESTDAEQTIWKLLVEAGHIEKSDIPPPASDFRDHLMRFLINQSFGFEDLKKVYRQYLKTTVLDAGKWEDVECEFYTGDIHNDDIEGLFIGDALLDLARSVISADEIRQYFEEHQYFCRTPDTDHILTSLSLTPEESFIASRLEIDRSVNIEELCLITGFSEEKVCRLVYVLLRLSICQWKSAPDKKSTPVKAARHDEEPDAQAYWRIAEQFFQFARKEFDQGNFWKVTELCKHAIRNDATQGKYYHLMAMAYAHHPRFLDDAEQCFNKAIELEPAEAEYHLSLARFFLNSNQHQRAASEIARALELDPDNPVAEMLQRQLQS